MPYFGRARGDPSRLANFSSLLNRNEDRQPRSMDYKTPERVTFGSVSTLTENSSSRRQANGLITWRLKRVREFIDLHLAHSITLADLAKAVGLSRMHFAAQFRRATGVRPHEYVLRRRVERSREMLVCSNLPVVQIALNHGFETQSHYSAVFKRIVGETPGRWRWLQKHCLSNAASTARL